MHVENGRIARVESDQGSITADRYVVALAAHAAPLLRPLGIRLPIYPIKGYSITAAIADSARAPVSTLLDETYKVAITRLGDRIRVGGMAEISGFSHDLPERRRSTLIHCLSDLFPGAAHLGDLSFWSGLRPMTPDGPPIIGRTKFPNLFLNVGHGTLGWTMACGSGHLLNSLICDEPAAIEAGDLALSRYQQF
jgi:D-amino-acid dehydrogenase